MKTSPGGYREDRDCPDGGRCSHLCPDENGCWRVAFCAPLSGYGEDWAAADVAANENPPARTESFIVMDGH